MSLPRASRPDPSERPDQFYLAFRCRGASCVCPHSAGLCCHAVYRQNAGESLRHLFEIALSGSTRCVRRFRHGGNRYPASVIGFRSLRHGQSSRVRIGPRSSQMSALPGSVNTSAFERVKSAHSRGNAGTDRRHASAHRRGHRAVTLAGRVLSTRNTRAEHRGLMRL
jgi:hypothetical protein